MNDQVGELVGRGVAAAAIHSHPEEAEQREVVNRFLAGVLALLYLSYRWGGLTQSDHVKPGSAGMRG